MFLRLQINCSNFVHSFFVLLLVLFFITISHILSFYFAAMLHLRSHFNLANWLISGRIVIPNKGYASISNRSFLRLLSIYPFFFGNMFGILLTPECFFFFPVRILLLLLIYVTCMMISFVTPDYYQNIFYNICIGAFHFTI